MSRNPESLAENAANTIGPCIQPLRAAKRRSQALYFIRYLCGHTLRFLKSLAARIDLSHFPGSCCG